MGLPPAILGRDSLGTYRAAGVGLSLLAAFPHSPTRAQTGRSIPQPMRGEKREEGGEIRNQEARS